MVEEGAASDQARQEAPLSVKVKLYYGLPALSSAAMAIPVAIYLPRFYSDELLTPLGSIAIAIALARVLDAVTDPAIGWLSDRTRTRWGRRRPWVALAAPLVAVTYFALFSPPDWAVGGGAVWLFACFSTYFLFRTMVSVPYEALGAELSLDYRERSSLFGYQAWFAIGGLLVGSVLPDFLQTTLELPARTAYRIMGTMYATLFLALFSPALLRLREREEFSRPKPNPLLPGVRRALRNRPFRILLLSSILFAIPAAIPGIMTPYTEYVIQPENPERWIMFYLIGYFGAGFVCLPLWIMLAQRLGKLPTFMIVVFVAASGNLLYFFAGPGDELRVLGFNIYQGMSSTAYGVLIPAMSADVIDYDQLRTGKRREGQLQAFWSIVPKLVAIPSAAVPLAVLGAWGYVPNQEQTHEVLFGIRAIYALFPIVPYLLAMVVMLRYPINEHIHRAIRDGITAHAAGEHARDPVTGADASPRIEGVGEDTSWHLDHFSRRELERLSTQGPRAVRRYATVGVARSPPW